MRRTDSPPRRVPAGERGAALLTVLLIVAVIAVLSGAALERLRLATRLGTSVVALDQARAWSYAAETLAVGRVGDLLAQSPARVTLAGDWSGKPFPLPIPNGVATARVSDGGNCFNLNGLVVQNAPGSYEPYPPARLQFARLMRLVGTPTRSPEAIAAAVTDWIDSDDAPLEDGAEDGDYLAGRGNGSPGYRTAGGLIADPSELRAIAGVTPEVYASLRPWVCALPKAAPSTINVNTLAPEQAALIAMLAPDTLSVEAARQMLLRRPPEGYDNVARFWQLPALAGITVAPNATAQTAVTTGWFALRVDVSIAGVDLEDHGLIDATRLPARLASRQWGEAS